MTKNKKIENEFQSLCRTEKDDNNTNKKKNSEIEVQSYLVFTPAGRIIAAIIHQLKFKGAFKIHSTLIFILKLNS